jgi:Family of unknown function (DUF6529)
MKGVSAVRSEGTRGPSAALLAGVALAGAGVSLGIGIYAGQHSPSYKSILGDGLIFSSTINMKVWLATIVAALALFQLYSSLRFYDRIHFPRTMPPWFVRAHHLSGTLAFLVSLPVAYHCTWALGFQFSDAPTRVAVHGLLGCFFYGAFAAKMLFLRIDDSPGWVLPVVGGLTFAAVIGIWLTSGLWFFENYDKLGFGLF